MRNPSSTRSALSVCAERSLIGRYPRLRVRRGCLRIAAEIDWAFVSFWDRCSRERCPLSVWRRVPRLCRPSRAPWLQWLAVGADVNDVYVRRRAPWEVRWHSVFFGKSSARRRSNAATSICVDVLSRRRTVALFPRDVVAANVDISAHGVDGCVRRVALNIKQKRLAPLKYPKHFGRLSSFATTKCRACSSG